MVLVIEITLPEGFSSEGLEVLHIHSESDISFIDNFKIENGKLIFETSKLSEIAFVKPVSKVAPSPKAKTGLPGWAIALIVIGSVLLTLCLAYFLLFFVFNKWIKEGEDEAVRVLPFSFGEKDDKLKMFRVPLNLVKKDGKTKFAYKPMKFVLRDKDEIFKTKDEALKQDK
jgi:hypothetical protein